MKILIAIDNVLSMFLSPLASVCLWAAVAAAFSMTIYAIISPQKKILALKNEQKLSRAALRAHEGNFSEMQSLIKRDLALALRQVGLVILPFSFSLLPAIWPMLALSERYTTAISFFGPEWMRGFDFWYIAVLLIVSLTIKKMFKIS